MIKKGRGRPRKIRIKKKQRLAAFGGRGAMKPNQIRAALGREKVRRQKGR